MLALGIVIPVLPQLVLSFVDGDHVIAADVYGIFATVWALMQFLFSPVQGALSDRFGRRPVILASNFGLGLDYMLMALAPNLVILFIGRMISGMTRREHLHRQRLHRRRDAAGGARREIRLDGCCVRRRLHHRSGAGRRAWQHRCAVAVLGRGRPERAQRLLRSISCCRSRCRPNAARTFSWRRANPVGALKLLRSHRELFGMSVVSFLNSLAMSRCRP